MKQYHIGLKKEYDPEDYSLKVICKNSQGEDCALVFHSSILQKYNISRKEVVDLDEKGKAPLSLNLKVLKIKKDYNKMFKNIREKLLENGEKTNNELF